MTEKSILNEICQKFDCKPHYETKNKGQPHNPSFTGFVTITFTDGTYEASSKNESTSKKGAENDAALALLELLLRDNVISEWRTNNPEQTIGSIASSIKEGSSEDDCWLTFGEPKQLLIKIFGTFNINLPKYETEAFEDKFISKLDMTTLFENSFNYIKPEDPSIYTLNGIGKTKKEAEKRVALKALTTMREHNLIDNQCFPYVNKIKKEKKTLNLQSDQDTKSENSLIIPPEKSKQILMEFIIRHYLDPKPSFSTLRHNTVFVSTIELPPSLDSVLKEHLEAKGEGTSIKNAERQASIQMINKLEKLNLITLK